MLLDSRIAEASAQRTCQGCGQGGKLGWLYGLGLGGHGGETKERCSRPLDRLMRQGQPGIVFCFFTCQRSLQSPTRSYVRPQLPVKSRHLPVHRA